MNACTINPHCRKSDGTITKSKLFEKLNNTFEYAKASKYYQVLVSPEFKKEFRDTYGDTVFDEDTGEPLFDEVLPRLHFTEDQLNSVFGKDNISYAEAFIRFQEFSKAFDSTTGYIMQLISKPNGKYNIKVVKPNSDADFSNIQAKNNVIIHKQHKLNSVIKIFSDAGINIDFINDESVQSESSYTIDIDAEDIHNVIMQIKSGDTNTGEIFKHAGLFLLDTLGENHPLVQRLYNMIDENTARKLLGHAYDKYPHRYQRVRMTAATLLQRAFAHEVYDSKFKTMVERIKSFLRSMLSKIPINKIKEILAEPMDVALEIAKGRHKIEDYTVTDAKKQTLYSYKTYSDSDKKLLNDWKKEGKNKILLDMKSRLEALAEDASIIDKEATEEMNAIVEEINSMFTSEIANNKVKTKLAEKTIINSLVKLINKHESLIGDIGTWSSKDPSKMSLYDITYMRNQNPHEYALNCQKIANRLRYIRSYVNAMNELSSMYKGIAEASENLPLMDSFSSFNSVYSIIEKTLCDEETCAYLEFLKTIYGSEHIDLCARLVFQGRKLERIQKEQLQIGDLHNNIFNSNWQVQGIGADITGWQLWMNMTGNNPDMVLQLVHMAKSLADKSANSKALQYKNRIDELETEFKKNFKNLKLRDLYEKTKDGKYLTGYYISDVRYGQWVTEKEEFISTLEDAFEDECDKRGLYYSDLISRNQAFESFSESALKEWNRTHSTFNKETKRYEPNKEMYINEDYLELLNNNPNLHNFLYGINGLVTLKEQIDLELLDQGIHTHPMKVPQYRTSFSNSIENANLRTNFVFATATGCRLHISNMFLRQCTDSEIGSAAYSNPRDFSKYMPGGKYNSDDRAGWIKSKLKNKRAFRWLYKESRDELYRLPMHGINNIEDKTLLSTDAFSNLFTYAAEACTYRAHREILDYLELGRNVMENMQKNEGIRMSNKEQAYLKYLKYHLYRESMPRLDWGALAGEKILTHIKNFCSASLLALKALPPLKDFVSNFVTFSGELIVNPQYHNKTMLVALGTYYQEYLKRNIIDAEKSSKKDFLSKLLRFSNMNEDIVTHARNIHKRETRLVKFMKESPYKLFSFGNHFFQSIELLKEYKDTKVYYTDENGVIRESDLLTVLKKQHKKNKKKELELPNNIFKNKEAISEFEILDNMYMLSESDPDLFLSQENADIIQNLYEKYFHKKVPNISNFEYRKRAISDIISVITVSDDDAGKATLKAQYRSDMMWGAYRTSAKTNMQIDPVLGSLTALKGYAFGNLNTKILNRNRQSIIANEDSEAMWLSTMKLLMYPVLKSDDIKREDAEHNNRNTVNMLDFIRVAIPGSIILDRFLGEYSLKTRMENSGFSESQYINVCKCKAWVGMTLLLNAVTKFMASSLGFGDDEKNKIDLKFLDENERLLGIIYYALRGAYLEHVAYVWPPMLIKEWQNLSTLLPTGINVVIDFFVGLYQFIGAKAPGLKDYDDDRFYYQENRGYDVRNAEKYIDTWGRIFPGYNNRYSFMRPFTATKANESFLLR